MNVKSWFVLLRHVVIKSIEKGEIIIKEGETGRDVFLSGKDWFVLTILPKKETK